MKNHWKVRPATAADVDIIVEHRRNMHRDMGCSDEAALEEMGRVCRPYFAAAMAEGSYHGWLAEDAGGKVVAGGGVLITRGPAHPRELRLTRATILNVYTSAAHRRKGAARQLMEAMLGWCRAEGFRTVTLHASHDGRALYESLGFEPTNEMRLQLERAAKLHFPEGRNRATFA
jgi:GNAT superfamily N-acetyltransferase